MENGRDMAQEFTKAELRAIAEQAGLSLPAEDLERLLSGVNRSRRQAEELRSWVSESVEPAPVFAAGGRKNN